MDIFKPNQTSSNLMVKYAEEKYYKPEKDKDIERYLVIYDIFIKARGYYIINKVFFFFSLISGLAVLLWPSLSIFATDLGWREMGFLNSAIVQTTVTGIAALNFAIYSHYKKRQLYAENLMRVAIFSEDSLGKIKDYVVKEMERIDSGFSFGKSLIKDESDHTK
ncbi:MAG: hypothetical protein ABIJ24_03250 [Nitrospinota bacterium]|nr:hypothetical protein [Nitrospinota bacterium]